MKTIIPFRLLFLSLILMLSISSCTQVSSQTPEEIGKEAFTIIKSIPETSFETFLAIMMSHEELQSLKPINPKGFDNFLGKVTPEEIEKDYKRDFERFKALADSKSTNWKDLSYSDFTYKLDSIDGYKLCDGRLKMKYGEELITVRTSSIFDGKTYVLAGMKPLQN